MKISKSMLLTRYIAEIYTFFPNTNTAHCLMHWLRLKTSKLPTATYKAFSHDSELIHGRQATT